MTWTEHDGPVVAPPTRAGFGQTVIEAIVRGNLKAEVILNYAPEGVRWSMVSPLSAVSDADASAHDPGTAPPVPAATEASAAPARILLVEDEMLIALDVKHMLEQAGYAVAGPIQSVREAFHQLDAAACTAAILDVNLGRETSEPIARRLRDEGVPFLAMSSYRRDQLPAVFAGADHIEKPVGREQLVKRLAAAIPSSVQ
jgi:CheY-like chemotaxis protein